MLTKVVYIKNELLCMLCPRKYVSALKFAGTHELCQMQSVLPLVEMEGCVAVAQEGKAYSQNTELKWKDKRITQSMKYQVWNI